MKLCKLLKILKKIRNNVAFILIRWMETERRLIAAGNHHYLFLDTQEDAVYGMGFNEFGQLGTGTKTRKKTPTRICALNSPILSVYASSGNSMFLDEDGVVYGCGANVCGELGLGDKRERVFPEKIRNLPFIISIAMTDTKTLFL